MHSLVTMLTRFINVTSSATRTGGALSQTFSAIYRTGRFSIGVLTSLATVVGGALFDGAMQVVNVFTSAISKTMGFNLSLSGLMDQAEEARRFFSELADEMNFYSSSTGSTKNAVNLLMEATNESLATHTALRGAFEGLVNAGVDTDHTIKEMLPTLGEFELKTGVAASQFSLLSGKFQQMFNEKKGINKDIKNLQKAMIGTGLKGSQLEQTMQGLTEAAEKLAFATNGQTLDIKKLSDEYSSTVATFKAFGVSAQTTTTFLNGLLDPENVEKNLLLMNKLNISYGEFNDMLNTGKGQDKFFDKILSNIGNVAKEAGAIEDASTRYKYLKDTVGLPPEIASKLMKVPQYKMRAELRKIKKEMNEAEKQDKWRKDLKAKEEKYEESIRFLRMAMVAPLVEIIEKNRDGVRNFMKAIKPLVQGIASMLKTFFKPISEWFNLFSKNLEKLTTTFKNLGEEAKSEKIAEFIKENIGGLASAISESFTKVWESDEIQKVIIPLAYSLGRIVKTAIEYGKEYAMGNDQITWEEAAEIVATKSRKAKVLDEKKMEKDFEVFNKVLKSTGYTYSNAWNHDQLKTSFENLRYDVIAKDKEAAKKEYEELKKNQQQAIEEAYDDEIKRLEEEIRSTPYAKDHLIERKKKLQEEKAVMVDQGNEYLKNLFAGFEEILNDTPPQNIQKPSPPIPPTQKGKESPTPEAPAPPKKPSAEELQNLMNKLMAEPSFVQAVSGALIIAKETQINNLMEKSKNNIEKIKIINLKVADLNKEIEAIATSSKADLSKEIKFGLFGDMGVQISIKEILLSIDETLTEQYNMDKKSKTKKQNPDFKISELEMISKLPSTGMSGLTNKASKVASSITVKNMQIKQIIYLQSISDSSYDSKVILEYIGRNLVFTESGLLTNEKEISNVKLYDIDGKETKDEVINNLGIAVRQTPLGTAGGAQQQISN